MDKSYKNWLNEKGQEYLMTVGNDISDLKKELVAETSKQKMAIMQISQEQGQMMKFLVKVTNSKRGIEIGTFTGYSSLCFAEGVGEGGHLLCLDVSEEWTNIAKKYWQKAGLSDRVTLKLAPAVETLDSMLEEEKEHKSWDFGFVDADKLNYMNYYQRLKKMIKKGGFILFDNVLWHGKVFDESNKDEDTQAIRQLNLQIAKDPDVERCMISIADGLTMVYLKN